MSCERRLVNQQTVGIFCSAVAYGAWGLLPLYWKQLATVPALEILAHRVLWAFLLSGGLVAIFRRPTASLVGDKRQLLLTLLGGVLISLNWYTYIWAVNANFVIEASMGYFINPLVLVLLGVTVFKERLNGWQLLAIVLAAIGVVILVVQYGRIPWIAFTLAATFATYGMLKKMLPLDPLTGLAVETAGVFPIALGFIVVQAVNGQGAFFVRGADAGITLGLVGAGAVTALPLLLFAEGARRIHLSFVGFLQYIAPTLNLLLGVFVFREPFSLVQLASFGFIWAGLVVFSLEKLMNNRLRTAVIAGIDKLPSKI